MTLSNNETGDAIGALRLGVVVLLAPLWLLGGIALVWSGGTLLGAGSIVIGLVMVGGGYRLYRAIERPDVVRDERMKEAGYRAGANAFWSMVLVPSLYFAFGMFIPQAITSQVAQWGGLEFVWPVSLVCGLGVYFGSFAYYRFRGRTMPVKNELKRYRTKHDLTREGLAIETGVSRQTINAIEAGKYTPSVALALKLADRFDVPIKEIFWVDDS